MMTSLAILLLSLLLGVVLGEKGAFEKILDVNLGHGK